MPSCRRRKRLANLPENLHQFVDDLTRLNVPALAVLLERARGLYEENLQAYVKTMLRRSFGRMMVSVVKVR